MRNVIVGTAGHVDHGKTCLIKALTGVDTDRLKEEKKRGITIELGFANLPNDSGLHIGIIDVPGHEKFVKNMLAGIGGIDLVLLVVALDEGVMPQTLEHFEILKMLNIPQGIVVYTKADLADPDLIEMVEDDVDELLKGSFMEDAPRMKVSAYTGEGIDELKALILEQVKTGGTRRTEPELFRLPIDRVFTMEGFGTVVTGTLMEGSLHAGDEVQIYPGDRLVKVRQIQSHGELADSALAGQRTALNLAGISKDDLERGQVMAAPGSMIPSTLIDAEVKLFDSSPRALKNGDHIHINYGSAQTECKAVLLDRDELRAGEEGLVQFRFETPVALKQGDRYIIRFLSPVQSFGGGRILDPAARKHKRNQEAVIDRLKLRQNGTLPERILAELEENLDRLPEVATVAVKLGIPVKELYSELDKLVAQNLVIRTEKGIFLTKRTWDSLIETANQLLEDYHKENPILKGMPKEEFKNRMMQAFSFSDDRKTQIVLDSLAARNRIKVTGNAVASTGFDSAMSDENMAILAGLESLYEKAAFEAPSTVEVVERYKDKKLARQMINELTTQGRLVKLDNDAYLHTDYWQKSLDIIHAAKADTGEITLAQFRDAIKSSRKYALLILEACDRKRITKLTGEKRIILR